MENQDMGMLKCFEFEVLGLEIDKIWGSMWGEQKNLSSKN